MARTRDIKISKYISPYKYRELKNFCLQYEEKKAEINYSIPPISSDGQPHATDISDPTYKKAERNARLKADIDLIEQTAIEASPWLYPYILKNVTCDTAFPYLDAPTSSNTFYKARRKFFKLLAEKR